MQSNESRARKHAARNWRATVESRFPDVQLVERTRFVMGAPLVELVRSGRKRTTIRFDERGVEYPSAGTLPIYSVQPGDPHETAMRATDVRLTGVRYVRLCELSDADARADGFSNRDELVRALSDFYPSLGSESLVAIYSFVPSASVQRMLRRPRCQSAEVRLTP